MKKEIKTVRNYCALLIDAIDNEIGPGNIATIAKELIYRLMIYQFARKVADPMEPVETAQNDFCGRNSRPLTALADGP